VPFAAEIVADFISQFSLRDVPYLTRDKIGGLATDLIGAAAAGFSTDPARATRTVAANIFQTGTSSVWFSKYRLKSCAAAFANSAAASALDVDDGHREAIGHPGAPVISAVFAEGEALSATNGELLSAIAIGYEIGVRVAAAQVDRIERREYATGRWASAAVAASIGYLRRLGTKELAQSLAIAATHRACQVPSGASNQLGQIKEGISWSTLGGFFAVSLAQQGIKASLDIFDISALFDSRAITRKLGEGLKVDTAYIKPYCCCRWIHSSVDALLVLMRKHDIFASDIEAIVVDTIGPAARLNNKIAPCSHFEAQFSLPYCVAVAALEGARPLLTPDMGNLADPKRIEFAQKVTVRADAELDGLFPAQTPSRVQIITRDGAVELQMQFAKGDAGNPMTFAEISEKFETLVRYGLDRRRADHIVASVRSAKGSTFVSKLLKAVKSNKDG
jgi:2-methylcitrate dehydratase PrpD